MIAARSRLPAALIINPNAGRLSAHLHHEVIDALGGRFDLQVHSTTGRDSAIEIAAEAATRGFPLVIAFGGDGHVNEVVNGLAGSESALGLIPGGTMNVFARALSLPMDPLQAVERLEEAVYGSPRTVPLGRMDDRLFTFSAGCGFDAEAAERVERYVPVKRHLGELFFYWSAFRVLAGSYRHRNPSMELRGAFGTVPVAMAIACNAGPYAYLAGRPITLAPQVQLERGLDVFALRKMRIEALPSYIWGSVMSGHVSGHSDAFYANDLEAFEVVADKPFARHVDGEPLAASQTATFRLIRDALRVFV
jgi:diacylglycerol kinase family enzyme